MQTSRFVARCRAAADWRASIGERNDDANSMAAAVALRGIADWAVQDPVAAERLAGQLLAIGLDVSGSWSEAQEYELTTFCLHGPEETMVWLNRVRDAGSL